MEDLQEMYYEQNSVTLDQNPDLFLLRLEFEHANSGYANFIEVRRILLKLSQ
jgi:hypothetical protein